jgi:V8-like Glu-specific endopeptidase
VNHPALTIHRVTGFGRGKHQTLEADAMRLGSATDCDVRFDPTWDKTVAAYHATLRWHEGVLWIEDQSQSGCWIDGQRTPRRQLASGTEIELGKGGPRVRVEYQPLPMPATKTVAPPSAPVPPAPRPQPAQAPLPAEVRRDIHLAPPAAATPSERRMWTWVTIGVASLLAFVLAITWWPSNADARLAQVAKDHEKAVGLVVVVVNAKDGSHTVPVATAWAIGPHTFATNGHVAEPISQALEKGGSAFIILNRHPDTRYRVTKGTAHPKYKTRIVNFEGREPAVPGYDVGLLEIEGTTETFFKLASRATLEKIDSGDRIGYLGFPMEGMAGGGVDFRNPVANMQSGIVTSVTDYWLSKAEFPNRLLIQHNLGAAGGSSGSPVFNPKGEVIGILSAGNFVGQVNLETGEKTRAPSAVMINFAQRIDILREILPADIPN